MSKIKYFRQNLGLTIKDVSEKAHIAVGYVSELENDEEGLRNPSRAVMIRISKVLGRTVPEIFFPDEKEDK